MKTKILIKVLKTILGRNNKSRIELNANDNEEEDAVEKCTGSFGLYQVFVLIVIGVSRFIPVWNFASIIFIVPKTEFTCVFWKESQKNTTFDLITSKCFEECGAYTYFHQDLFQSTLISRFELICERAWLIDLMRSLMFLGAVIGSLLFGWIADKSGRRNAIRLATFYMSIIMLPTVFSLNIWMFIVLRFISGAISAGILITSTLYILEIVGTRYKAIAASCIMVTDSIGLGFLTVFAKYSSTWDIFMLKYGMISVLFLILVLTLPDTPRWLVANQRVEKAIEIVTRAASWNKVDITIVDEQIREQIEKIKIHPMRSKIKYWYLFNKKKTMLRSICLVFLYFQIGFEYFYTSFNISNFGFDLISSTLALVLFMVSASIFSAALNWFFGRRSLLILLNIITSFSMIFKVTISGCHFFTNISDVIAFCSIIIRFIVCCVITAELYPTLLRGTIFGQLSSALFLGLFAATSLQYLGPDLVTTLILLFLSFLAAIFSVILPETKGKPLIDTIN